MRGWSKMGEEIKIPVFTRKATGLTKEIGPWTAWLIPWYSIAGSGITIYAVQIYAIYPKAIGWIGMGLAGLPAIFSAINIALLGVCMPRSAGGYVWATRFVDPFVGWLGAGWFYFFTYWLAIGLLTFVGPQTVGTMLTGLGYGLGSQILINVGVTLQKLWAVMIFSVLWNIFMLVLNATGLRWFIRAMWIFWIINFIGVFTSGVLYFTITPDKAKVLWDATWGTGTWDAIVRVTDAHNFSGWVESASKGVWGDTVACMMYLFWAYTAWETLAYVGGEVRSPRVSFLYFYVLGLASCTLMYIFLTAGPVHAYGQDFLARYNYLYTLYKNEELTEAEMTEIGMPIIFPCQPLFSSSLGKGAVKVLAGFWFYPLTAVLACYLAATRVAFGMAFDRYFPEFLATVSERFHAPIGASIFVFVMALILNVLVATGYGIFVTAASLSFYTAWFCMMYAWAAMSLPHKRPDVWERGLKKKIFGITELEFFGFIATILLFMFLILAAIGMSLMSLYITTLWVAIGVILWLFFRVRNEKRGITPADTFGEIPPA